MALHGRDSRGDQCQVDSNSVSVLVDHFSAFSLVGRARPHTRGKATKRMLAAVFAPPPRVNDDWALNVILMDDTEAAFKVCLLFALFCMLGFFRKSILKNIRFENPDSFLG